MISPARFRFAQGFLVVLPALTFALTTSSCREPAATGGPAGPSTAPMTSAPGPAAASAPPPASTVETPSQGPRLVAYGSGYGPTIDLFAVDPVSGALRKTAAFPAFGSAPTFLAFDAGVRNLYALDEGDVGQVGAYRIDPASGGLTFLGAVSSGGKGPAHLSLDRAGRFVLVANYGDGSVSVLPVRADAGGSVGPALQTLRVGAQAHMILTDPSNRFAFVPCKGSDYVAEFVFDAATGALRPNAKQPRLPTASGAGPRHLAFHPNGRFAYLINELDNTMTALSFDPTAGTLTPIETKSTLPGGFAGTDTAAEVWVHPSGAWLFGSNRGDDSIVLFAIDPVTGKLTPKGHTKTGGHHPRDFTLDPTGAFLYVANQKSDLIAPFRFDASSGSLVAGAPPVDLPAASYIGLVRLPGR
jgi:6-phosphogluconolactonase